MHIVIIKVQVQMWRTQNKNSIGLGLFTIINNLFIDLMNPHMLKCVNCKFQQVDGNILNQSFVIHKGFIKYNKANDVTPMKTHVDSLHLHLVVKRKLILIDKSIAKHDLDHSQ